MMSQEESGLFSLVLLLRLHGIATEQELQRLAHHRMVVRQCARRYRARRRNGARCLRIQISNAEQTLDAFVKIGVLAEERRNDDKAIEHAIAVLCRRGYSAIKAEGGPKPVRSCAKRRKLDK